MAGIDLEELKGCTESSASRPPLQKMLTEKEKNIPCRHFHLHKGMKSTRNCTYKDTCFISFKKYYLKRNLVFKTTKYIRNQ